MRHKTLDKTIQEARRFIGAAEAVRDDPDEFKYITGNMTTSACKRASMDLTRALSDLRQGR